MRRLGRTLFAFLVRAVVVVALIGIAISATLLSASAALPDLRSPDAIEALLRQEVEGQRTVEARRTLQNPAPFVIDDDLFLSPAGKALLSASGCTDANAASPEAAGAFRLRLFERWLRQPGPPGPGKCELSMAEALVSSMGLQGSHSERLLAAARVRDALPHHLLLADWGSSYPFSPAGPFGLDEAAARLFGKPANKLDWNEASLLSLATDFFDEVDTCRHPPKLKSMRDPFLDRLASLYPDEAKVILAAKSLPLPCERPPPPAGFAKPKLGAGAP